MFYRASKQYKFRIEWVENRVDGDRITMKSNKTRFGTYEVISDKGVAVVAVDLKGRLTHPSDTDFDTYKLKTQSTKLSETWVQVVVDGRLVHPTGRYGESFVDMQEAQQAAVEDYEIKRNLKNGWITHDPREEIAVIVQNINKDDPK